MDISTLCTTLAVLFISLLHLTCSEEDHALEVLKRARRVKRVIGGMQVDVDGRWPWIAHLDGKIASNFLWGMPIGYTHLYCGGTILGSRWVLTAAHCIRMDGHPERSEWPKYWHIRAGENDNTPSVGDRIRSWLRFIQPRWRIWNVHADRIIVHPDYSEGDTWKNDIALIRLRTPLPVNSPSNPTIKTAVLPPSEVADWPADGEECVMKGWGCEQAGGRISEHLQMARMPKMNDDLCRGKFGNLDLTTRLCAGYSNRGIGICAGDSGGPLVCKRNGDWYLAGIASYTAARTPENFPGVFTDVSKYVPWIRRTMALNS